MRRTCILTLTCSLLLPALAPPVPAAAVDTITMPAELLGGLAYRFVGPTRGGRVTAVAGHPGRPSTFYLGASGGGVWRTDDYGQSWRPISDGYFESPSIGAITVAPSDPDVVYVATGSDGLRSNVIIGRGVYRSRDAGETWEHVGLRQVGNTGAVLVHPTDPDLVYVAAIGNPFAPSAERGVYRSRDGGDTWELVLHVSEHTGAVDLEFAPDDPGRIYASMWQAERKPWTIISGGLEGGVFRSTDGGDRWERLTEGLPAGLRGKSDLAVSAGDPDRVYLLIEAPESAGGVYRSDDRGDSWRQVSDFQPIRNRPFYYTNLHAHPLNADVLWGMAEGYYKSEDGGVTWRSQDAPHGDNHDLWINPENPEVMIQSNDGGANVTRDGGATWSTQDNQGTAELYQVDVDDGFPYRLYAGQQDNTTISVPGTPLPGLPGGATAQWREHGGCETGPAVPKPGDPGVVYANCKGVFGLFNARTGQEQMFPIGMYYLYGRNPADLPYRFQRVSPVHVSPHDAGRVYMGSQYVHVTTDGGRTWQRISPDLTAFSPETQVVSGSPITIDVTGEEHFSVLYDIQESPHEAGVIWAGANDGPVHVTRDNGVTWKLVTPAGLGPFGRVQTIEVSSHRPAKAYLSVLRYQLGDFSPLVFRTEDYGDSWTRITTGDNGIPADVPVRVVREDPVREGLLYAGTEFGMYVSFDDGRSWQSLQLNLPVTPVTDIKIVRQDLVLSTMGRGFWILDDVSRLQQLAPEVSSTEVQLFQPRTTYRLRGAGAYEPRASTPGGPAPAPSGVVFDYWIGDSSAAARLQIMDSSGALLREFDSTAAGETVQAAEPGMRAPMLERLGTPRLPASPSQAHRFVWDLRAAGPWSVDARRSGRGGPLVPPGRYSAELTVGDESSMVTFELELDPRVASEGVTAEDVTAQYELLVKLREALDDAQQAVVRIEELLPRASGDRLEQLQALRAQLVTAEIRYSPPMLIDLIEYVYRNLSSADQLPGQDAHERFGVFRAELDGVIARLAALQ